MSNDKFLVDAFRVPSYVRTETRQGYRFTIRDAARGRVFARLMLVPTRESARVIFSGDPDLGARLLSVINLVLLHGWDRDPDGYRRVIEAAIADAPLPRHALQPRKKSEGRT